PFRGADYETRCGAWRRSRVTLTAVDRKKNRSNRAWLHEHVHDHWVQEAKARGYRARAAFKLLEIDDRDGLLKPGMTVVDLGAAPGSWSQVAAERLKGRGRIVALDLLPIAPIA